MMRYDRSTTQIRARVGESFVVALRVHATAGYDWHIAHQPDTIRLNRNEKQREGAGLGATSCQELEFVATHSGEHALVLVCQRPWEATAVDHFDVTITIHDAT